MTSIGARFETRKCPDLSGETAPKLPHAQDEDLWWETLFGSGQSFVAMPRAPRVARVLRPEGLGQLPARRANGPASPKDYGKALRNIKQQRDLEPCCGLGIRGPPIAQAGSRFRVWCARRYKRGRGARARSSMMLAVPPVAGA